MSKIQQLINNYQPTEQAVSVVRRAKITLLVGISGAGKDTVKRRLLESGDFRDIVSYTTRPPRCNLGVFEQNGLDYNFIDDETAMRMLENHEFVEAKFVHGTVYGTGLREIQAIYEAGKIAITDIDVQGVAEYKAISPDVTVIFLVPPDYNTWLARLKNRYTTEAEFEAEWPKRRDSAIKELAHVLEVPYFNIVINDKLDKAIQDVLEVIKHGSLPADRERAARLAASKLLQQITTPA